MSKKTPYGQFYKKANSESTVKEETIEPKAIPEEPVRMFAVVEGAAKVNMRSQPNTSAKILNVLDRGTEVELILPVASGIWTEIAYKEQTGWMMAKYLKRV